MSEHGMTDMTGKLI